MRLLLFFCLFTVSTSIFSCKEKSKGHATSSEEEKQIADSLNQIKEAEEAAKRKPITSADITLTKELSYDKHTLEDSYPYKDTTRSFQWDKIKEKLAFVENFQRAKHQYGILQNHRNKNREAPLVEKWERNAYKRVADTLGTERWQSAPLYPIGHDIPVIYGRDGSLVSILSSDTIDMVRISGVSFEGEYEVPKRYVYPIGDSVTFHQVAFVDLTNQNICTVEKTADGQWKILSMNPATSGKRHPPYSMVTPAGMFVVQEKKSKMYFLKDGTSTIHGYAPYASRFTNGAYIHGIPVNNPNGSIIEYSSTLGTIPRSHMCVRNASSHSKFVYDLLNVNNSLIIVID